VDRFDERVRVQSVHAGLRNIDPPFGGFRDRSRWPLPAERLLSRDPPARALIGAAHHNCYRAANPQQGHALGLARWTRTLAANPRRWPSWTMR
jgi:hypothetical protein